MTRDSQHSVPPRYVSVTLHCVAPARWMGCLRVLWLLQQLARESRTALPVTLLVVPALHGRPPTRPFVRWLRKQHALGHEIALHGFTHRAETPPPPTLGEYVRRNFGRDAGEFGQLSRAEAARRIAAARAWAATCQLPTPGFVPPDWALGDDAAAAVAEAGFEYLCTRRRIVALPGHETLYAPGIAFSTHTAIDRAGTLLWNRALAWSQQSAPLLRIELHSHDADHPSISDFWVALLRRALRRRQPLRLSEAAALARDRTWALDEAAVAAGAGGITKDYPAGPLRRIP